MMARGNKFTEAHRRDVETAVRAGLETGIRVYIEQMYPEADRQEIFEAVRPKLEEIILATTGCMISQAQ
jgi:hypothetical protein